MKCYSYVVVRDYGFAPNPFHGYCTLATCKPHIRKLAMVGDWVIGCGSAKNNASGSLVYAMKVNVKLTYNQYWEKEDFGCKKPVMNGSLKQMYGDNIYHFDNSKHEWIQIDSHHSNEDGSENLYNMKRDLKSEYVLVSSHFWYLGGKSIPIPKEFRRDDSNVCCKGIGHLPIKDENLINQFVYWLENQSGIDKGYTADPLQFSSFERYRGT